MDTTPVLAALRTRAALVASLLAVVAVANLLALAAAQTVLEAPTNGFRVEVPSGWAIDEDGDAGETMYFVTSPGGEGGLVIAAAPLDGPELGAYRADGLVGLLELSFALVEDLPGVQRAEAVQTSVAGVPAMGYAFRGGELGGRFVYFVANDRIYVLGTVADAAGAQLLADALDRAIASFAFTGAAGGGVVMQPGGNPLDAAPAPAFAGTFAGDGVTLVLERGGDGYVGTLGFQGQTYPVTAREVGADALAGQFVSGGDAFAFDLTRSGDALTLVTGSSRFTLR